jgi:hypothetical protein
LSTSGSVSAAEFRVLWTSHQETANAAAVSEAARLQTTSAGPPTGMSRIRWRRRARVGKTARGAAGLGRGFAMDPALTGTRQFGTGDAVAGALKMAVPASGRRQQARSGLAVPDFDDCVENIHHSRATGPSAFRTRNPDSASAAEGR